MKLKIYEHPYHGGTCDKAFILGQPIFKGEVVENCPPDAQICIERYQLMETDEPATRSFEESPVTPDGRVLPSRATLESMAADKKRIRDGAKEMAPAGASPEQIRDLVNAEMARQNEMKEKDAEIAALKELLKPKRGRPPKDEKTA